MPTITAWRRTAAIRRNQTYTSRAIFLAELRDSLPRVVLDGRTDWQANGRAIDRARQADEFLRTQGFDRWGRPLREGRVS